MISEVEKNQHLIIAGDKLLSQGGSVYVVDEIFKGGFVATDDCSTEIFYFKELQMGWDIMNSTKTKNATERRFVYIN